MQTLPLPYPTNHWHITIRLTKSSLVFFLAFRTALSRSTDPSTASPDTSGILCCEVCGKYGLPREFSASGRFCSLSCVGVYTGRRNKGREYVRHAKTVDGKIVKRKKKDKAKNRELSPYTDLLHVRSTDCVTSDCSQ